YLNNDVTRRHLTVDLSLRLLEGARPHGPAGPLPADRLAAPGMRRRAWLSRSSALMTSGVIELIGDAEQRSSLQQGLVVAPLVAQAVLGQPLGAARWPAGVRWLAMGVPMVSAATLAAIAAAEPARVAVVIGHDGADRLAAAAAFARERCRR